MTVNVKCRWYKSVIPDRRQRLIETTIVAAAILSKI